LLDFDGFDQLQNVVELLQKNQWTRKAVIQLFDHADLASRLDEVPCTCTLQFLLRDGALELIVHMRSNDSYIGLPHDVFAFTMIQEWVARLVGTEPGKYFHIVGSLHLYERDRESARACLSEGWQSNISMPAMPATNTREAMDWLLSTERQLRLADNPLEVDLQGPDPYWSDLACLLAIFGLIRRKRILEVKGLQAALNSRAYDLYIAERMSK
jgi:thymidylate synthase